MKEPFTSKSSKPLFFSTFDNRNLVDSLKQKVTACVPYSEFLNRLIFPETHWWAVF